MIWIFRFLSVGYNRLLQCLVEGPWGPFHTLSIWIFRRLFSVKEPRGSAKKLSDFFLRSTTISLDSHDIVSPAEGQLLEGPATLLSQTSVSIKGLDYAWSSLPELAGLDVSSASFWNIYLAPHNYHWVHAPSDGSQLEARFEPGYYYPVNALGRWLSPKLYAYNTRMSFRWMHPVFGRCILLCVGAMGVSRFECPKGAGELRRWRPLCSQVSKGESLLGFRLGSSVLLVLEKNYSGDLSRPLPRSVRVGESL